MKAVVVILSFFAFSIAFADYRAHLGVEGRAFLDKQPDSVQRYEGLAEAEYENTFSLNKNLSVKLHPFFKASSLPRAYGADVLADPREIYFSSELNNYFLHAGYFTLVYEGTDGLNPMDIASMKHWGDPLSPVTRASAGIHFGFTGNKIELEAAYIPEQTRSTLPGAESAWLPHVSKFPLRTDEYELRLSDRVRYIFLDPQVLDHAFQHNYTARAQLRTDYGDAAVAFFEGAADAPLITVPTANLTAISFSPKPIYQLDSPVGILPKYYRRRTVAGLVTATWGEWIFRAASRYDQPLGSAKQVTTWSGRTVAGVERTVTLFDDQITFVVQGSFVQAPKDKSLVSIQDLFDKAILAGVRWPVNDDWTLQLSGLRSGSDKSSYYTAQVAHTFATSWSAKVQAEILEGPAQSVLGIFDKNDRVSLGLTRSF